MSILSTYILRRLAQATLKLFIISVILFASMQAFGDPVATLGVANAILYEAYVSFLGLGVQGATATWGNMLDSAVKYIQSAPWLWFFPGLLILLTVLCINFIGGWFARCVRSSQYPAHIKQNFA